ncbi:predicted protein [Arabidopsis lyrata subsp. lyrata]|uniref:Predicted protein n=1 Tax=Arabidopsis lyrata subsp. lyrata TaxID=81972 RepID=D7M9P7_ARALL|nr:predicted protein [Arabidopsis lyrata subsp. lyrata]
MRIDQSALTIRILVSNCNVSSLVLKIGRLGADRKGTAAILSKSIKKIGDPIFVRLDRLGVRLARLDGA